MKSKKVSESFSDDRLSPDSAIGVVSARANMSLLVHPIY